MLRYGITISRTKYSRHVTVSVSAVFNRDMKQIYNIAKGVRTFIVDGILHMQRSAFTNAKQLRSVVFGEGLEVLG